MKERKRYLYLNSFETDLVIRSLIDLRNTLISEGRYPDCLNEIIEIILNSPMKKIKY